MLQQVGVKLDNKVGHVQAWFISNTPNSIITSICYYSNKSVSNSQFINVAKPIRAPLNPAIEPSRQLTCSATRTGSVNMLVGLMLTGCRGSPLLRGRVAGAGFAVPGAVRVSCQAAVGTRLAIGITAVEGQLGQAD